MEGYDMFQLPFLAGAISGSKYFMPKEAGCTQVQIYSHTRQVEGFHPGQLGLLLICDIRGYKSEQCHGRLSPHQTPSQRPTAHILSPPHFQNTLYPALST